MKDKYTTVSNVTSRLLRSALSVLRNSLMVTLVMITMGVSMAHVSVLGLMKM